MNPYRTPELVKRGSVIRATEGMFNGTSDTDGISAKSPVGSVGFGL